MEIHEGEYPRDEGGIGTAIDVDVWQTPYDLIHDDGLFRLIRYRCEGEQKRIPVLQIPSYISRPYILDLQPDVSVVRQLLDHGFSVYMIDWGYPGKIHRFIDMVDYIDYIDFCLDVIREETGENQVTLHGYCLGGTLSVMFAALKPWCVRNLITQASPVDFDNDAPMTRWARCQDPDQAVPDAGGSMCSFFDSEFSSVNVRTGNGPSSAPWFLQNRFRVDRWIHDLPNIPAAAYKHFIFNLYKENQLIKGDFKIYDRCIDLSLIESSLLVITGERDILSPPCACLPLLEKSSSSDREQMILNRGHIGLSVSREAHRDLWPKVCSWLSRHSS